MRQGAAGAAYFEPGGVCFWDFPWWPAGYIDSEIFNRFVPVSFGDRRCAMRTHDFVSDGFLALIVSCLVMLCSGLLVLAFS